METFDIAIAYCWKCKEKQPIDVSVMKHEGKDIELGIVFCCVCDTVLNFDEEPKVEYVNGSWMTEHGFTQEEQVIT